MATFEKAQKYLNALIVNQGIAGEHLSALLHEKTVSSLSIEEFIELLMRTKKPKIYAESAIFGDGTDWNQIELSILGDIGISVPVVVYDNGLHSNPDVHKTSFLATLLYVPGALLRNDHGKPAADWDEVTQENQINFSKYYNLYERRLLPLFRYTNIVSGEKNKQAFITIPGLGCGQFAGPFKSSLKNFLKDVLVEFLEKHSQQFKNIRAVYYDPYRQSANERFEIDGISLLVRPLLNGNKHKPQLCSPKAYEEEGDDFSNCKLFSFVAWDHVSWPGNDFFGGHRSTDDGVKAAATNSMAIMTGFEGAYNPVLNVYEPPSEYRYWEEVVYKNKLYIHVQDNLKIIY